MPDNYQVDNLSDVKQSYLDLYKLLSVARKNGLDKIGKTELLFKDLNKIDCMKGGNLEPYLTKLEENGVISKIENKLFTETTVNRKKVSIIVDCKMTWEELQSRALNLYNPNSYGLTVPENGLICPLILDV